MVNHTNARDREETPHTTKSTKNNKLNLNGTAKSTKRKALNLNGTAKSTENKTLNLNGRPKKADKTSVPGAVATGSQAAKNTPTLNKTSKTIITNAVRRRAQTLIKDRSIDAQSRALIRYGLAINDPWLPELVRRADAGETIIYTVNSLKHPHPARKIQARRRWKH